MGRAVKNSLEIIIKQVRLEGGFERGGRIRVGQHKMIRKRSFTKCFCVYSRQQKPSWPADHTPVREKIYGPVENLQRTAEYVRDGGGDSSVVRAPDS